MSAHPFASAMELEVECPLGNAAVCASFSFQVDGLVRSWERGRSALLAIETGDPSLEKPRQLELVAT